MSIQLSIEHTDIYHRLLVEDVRQQLPGVPLTEGTLISDDELGRLMSVASTLALSDDPEVRTTAYEIATRTVELKQSSSPGLIIGAELILARLGNFPGRQLLQSRYISSQANKHMYPVYLMVETMAREQENTIETAEGNAITLTDFQHDLYMTMGATSAASVSAPTSAGKSFILSLDIVRRLSTGQPLAIAFIVPTRALIREVMNRIAHDLNAAGLDNVPLRCVPLPLSREAAPHGVVYVLTQERLLTLLHSDDGDAWITTVIIDEAQGIQDGSRGILLHSAIDEVIEQFPNVQLYFASPLVKNPEHLLYLFEKRHSGSFINEKHSPVSQNLIIVSEVRGKISQSQFSLLLPQQRLDLGTYDLEFPLRGSKFEQRALLAKSITSETDCTIVFADFPSHTESLAEALILDGSTPDILPQEISELIDFLREHIHEEYRLIEVLKHRIAFHYGFMPAIVRARVEDLFQMGKLRYICCTSTLLQGVNLPARNIVIENPRSGRGRPMKRTDFLNLAGRAGRLLKEFHGNVWCLRADKWDKPEGSDKQCFEGEILQEITAAFPQVLADGGSLIQKTIDGTAESELEDMGIASLGKVFSEFTQAGKSLADSKYANSSNIDELRKTDEKCAEIKVSLPPHVFRRNSTILPMRLQELYDLLSAESNIINWLPLLPQVAGSYERTENIFQVCEEQLGGVNTITNRSYRFDAWLASRWVHDCPLKQMIDERKQRKPAESIGKIINEMLEALEERIRFRYVKYIRAYNDVLGAVLQEKGLPELAEQIKPLHLFLECGASNRVVLNLISLGLTRTTALLLKGQLHFSDDASPEQCLSDLVRLDLSQLRIPAICRKEIDELRRTR